MAGFAMASIGALLVSAVHESTSEQKGNNRFEEGARQLFDEHRRTLCCPVLFIISAIYSLWWHRCTKASPNNKASQSHRSAIMSPLPSPRFARCAMKHDGSLHVS